MPISGVFRPPVDGTYLLTVYARSRGNDGIMRIKNGDSGLLCKTWIADEEGEISSCTAIAELRTTNTVRVTGDNANPAELDSGYAGFAGHLIQTDHS